MKRQNGGCISPFTCMKTLSAHGTENGNVSMTKYVSMYLNMFLPVGQTKRAIPVCLLPECLKCGTNTRSISSVSLT